MYVTSFRHLFDLVEERLAQQDTIQRKVDEFVEHLTGVRGFIEMGNYLLPKSGLQGVLARQIPSISIEDVSFFLGARAWGISPIAWSLIKDQYCGENHEKRSRVHMTWIEKADNGTMGIVGERVANLKGYTNSVLETISTSVGNKLPEFHQNLRDVVWNGNYPVIDCSRLWIDMASRAKKKPPMNKMLPSSSWYYPLYLSLFCDGRAALFETYDNPVVKSVGRIQDTFHRTMRMIEAVVGVKPLIVKIPHQTEEVLAYRKDMAVNKQTSWVIRLDDTIEHFTLINETLLGKKQ